MKSLPELKEEAGSLQTEIKKILLDNYRFDEPLNKRLEVISTVRALRDELTSIQREIRERLAA